MSEKSQFDHRTLRQVAIDARAAATAKIAERLIEDGDIAKEWIFPSSRALDGLCHAEEALWQAGITDGRNCLLGSCLLATTCSALAAGFMRMALVPISTLGSELYVTLAFATAAVAACRLQAAIAARGYLLAFRARGHAEGAGGVFLNHGRSLVAIGSRALYVVKNRIDLDGSPAVTVLQFRDLGGPSVEIFENEAIVSLRSKDGALIRNLIFYGLSADEALNAAELLRSSNQGPNQAFNSSRRLSRRVSAV